MQLLVVWRRRRPTEHARAAHVVWWRRPKGWQRRAHVRVRAWGTQVQQQVRWL
jgi:hypothetical protein